MSFIGKLTYEGQDRGWRVTNEHVTLDLKEAFWRFAVQHQNQPVTQTTGRDNYTLAADAESEFNLDFETVGAGVLVAKPPPGFGFSNVTAYLGSSLMSLNERQVEVVVSDTTFAVKCLPDERVHTVLYSDGNNCRVLPSDEIGVCKLGSGRDTCIFLLLSANQFQCAKFNGSTASFMLDRHMKGEMKAGRVGDCRCNGREDRVMDLCLDLASLRAAGVTEEPEAYLHSLGIKNWATGGPLVGTDQFLVYEAKVPSLLSYQLGKHHLKAIDNHENRTG